MTTTKNPVSRKSGIIALSCALLALTFLSGCSVPNSMEAIDQLNKECSRKGGASTISVQFISFYLIAPTYVGFSCTLPSPSELGAKK